MTPTRRTLIKGGVAALAAPGLARAVPMADIAIHDSRLSPAPPALRSIDLVNERRQHWTTVRSGLGQARRVTGISSWSDYVLIAHELERRGFRKTAEARSGRLWRWQMEKTAKA